MKKIFIVSFIFLNFFLIPNILITGCSTGNNDKSTSGNLKIFMDELEKKGFTIQKGDYGFQDAIALCSAGVTENCLGGNVASPYVAYKMPVAPGQAMPNMKIDPDTGLGFAYPLRNDEAIVQIGITPPKADYFSYQSYLTLRFDNGINKYVTLFNSMGDSINNLSIKPGGGEGSPFSQPVMIISTADKGIDRMIREAADAAGYSENIINTDVIPSTMLNMGLEGNVDFFSFFSRIAMPESSSELEEYLKNPGSVILRLTPQNQIKTDPFPYPSLRVRGTGKTELDLLSAVEDLRTTILAKYENLVATEIPTYIATPEGISATQSYINTIGDSRDAAYLSTMEVQAWTKTDDSRREATFTLGDNPDEFVIIYGVSHEATGKATYSNCVVYGLKYLNGVVSIDSRTFKGSADAYLPDNEQSEYLYAWKICRNSNGELNCTEVPVGPKRYGIELDDRIIILFRAYLEQSTGVGPAYNELLFDRVIKFSPK